MRQQVQAVDPVILPVSVFIVFTVQTRSSSRKKFNTLHCAGQCLIPSVDLRGNESSLALLGE